MVKIGSPNEVEIDSYFCADDGWLIQELHKANCQPVYRDGSCVYFKKNKKLLKVLKKLEIEYD